MAQRLSKETAARLLQLSTFPEESLDAIASQLEAVAAKPFQSDEISAAFSNRGLSAEDASELSATIVNFYWRLIQSRQTVTEFVAEIVDSPDVDPKTNKEVLRQRLVRLLGIRSIFVGQNALSLIYDNERVISGARVISDLRPVFGPRIEDGPAGAIVMHTLKLEYQTVNGPAEFFLSLSLEDVDTLLASLQRAKDKDAKLRAAYQTIFFS